MLINEAIVTFFFFFYFSVIEPAALSPKEYMYMAGYEIMYVRMMRPIHTIKANIGKSRDSRPG